MVNSMIVPTPSPTLASNRNILKVGKLSRYLCMCCNINSLLNIGRLDICVSRKYSLTNPTYVPKKNYPQLNASPVLHAWATKDPFDDHWDLLG